jgi:hypothetical protein
MYDSSLDLLDALRATPAVLEGLLRGCTQEEARVTRGGDEGWSVVEVICHLRDAEERALERMQAMRDEVNPFLAAYDQERWAIERRYATADLHEAFAAFVRLRTQHVHALAALTPAEWERTGEHEEQGRMTITNQTLHMASHDAIHGAQIARQLQR